MSIFRRGEIWYASYSTPGGKRIKESLGTSDKWLATELHDKRKAELWRVDRLGDFPDVTFDDACMRWLEEKAEKKSLKDDRSRMAFWLAHFEGARLKDVTEQKVYSAVNRMSNRKQLEIWKIKAAAAQKNGELVPVYSAKLVTTSTKAKHLALMKAILLAAERDWKWLEKAPVIKIPSVRNKRVRWLEHEEAKRLIDECPEPLRSVVKFALATGLRRSNIINLEWQQIDMQRRVA
ncbi:integrase [Salmonella enterica]|nr:integrase [Salmonella enterica]